MMLASAKLYNCEGLAGHVLSFHDGGGCQECDSNLFSARCSGAGRNHGGGLWYLKHMHHSDVLCFRLSVMLAQS